MARAPALARALTLIGTGIKGTCTNVMGMVVEIAGLCWQHIHPQEYSVIDFSYWAQAHEGNSFALKAGRSNPIKRFAEMGSAELRYPSHAGHDDTRWVEFLTHGKYARPAILGRLGDTKIFNELPEGVKTVEMAAFLNAGGVRAEGSFMACGSPGEVANVPLQGRRLSAQLTATTGTGPDNLYLYQFPRNTKKIVFLNVAFQAQDQLRQRVAWGLSQIWTCASVGPGGAFAERWSTYHDIFVRNAFGNVRDILKEVAYSPLMADYLTYMKNKGLAAGGTFPDENMAREMMQLFTIGLRELNMNGSAKVKADGSDYWTYSNDHVMSFARVWTSFDRQPLRSNIEHDREGNHIDPLQIKPTWKDTFPKTNLYGGFIGDSYPLCEELPTRFFLRQGARYERLKTRSGEPLTLTLI